MGAVSADELKRAAAWAAVERVRSGMVLGLGTGSTTTHAIHRLGELWQRGALCDLVGIPTSERTRALAEQYRLPLATLAEKPRVDLAIDGADEVDANLELIKGLGGALLREKEVARAAAELVIIVDEGKLVERLGTRAPVPVEVALADVERAAQRLRALGGAPSLRGGATPYVTDNGNAILDFHVAGGIADPAALAAALDACAEVRAHGLFLGLASEVIVAGQHGLRYLRRGPRR